MGLLGTNAFYKSDGITARVFQQDGDAVKDWLQLWDYLAFVRKERGRSERRRKRNLEAMCDFVLANLRLD